LQRLLQLLPRSTPLLLVLIDHCLEYQWHRSFGIVSLPQINQFTQLLKLQLDQQPLTDRRRNLWEFFS
jgi:hypothetical protein